MNFLHINADVAICRLSDTNPFLLDVLIVFFLFIILPLWVTVDEDLHSKGRGRYGRSIYYGTTKSISRSWTWRTSRTSLVIGSVIILTYHHVCILDPYSPILITLLILHILLISQWNIRSDEFGKHDTVTLLGCINVYVKTALIVHYIFASILFTYLYTICILMVYLYTDYSIVYILLLGLNSISILGMIITVVVYREWNGMVSAFERLFAYTALIIIGGIPTNRLWDSDIMEVCLYHKL